MAPFGGRLGLVLLVVALAVGWTVWKKVRHLVHFEHTMGGRLHIADGDSLELDGIRIRLIGIDAPELDQPCSRGGSPHPCGREARDHLVALIGARDVTCAWSKLDKYHRRLGRCRAGDTDLNATMVRDGWAVAYGGYGAEESDARTHGRGLWSGTFTWPQDFRREKKARGSGYAHGFLDAGPDFLDEEPE